MSDNDQEDSAATNEDAVVDAVAAVFIILIPVIAIIYWLSGMPD